MSEFSFEWMGTGSLEATLREPISSVSASVTNQGTVSSMKIWHQGGRGIEIYSKMHELGVRDEVGVLCFSEVDGSSSGDRFVEVGGTHWVVSSVQKLSMLESRVGLVESGIVLNLTNGREITIVAGSFPCSLAIGGIPELRVEFQPEYDLAKYERSSILA